MYDCHVVMYDTDIESWNCWSLSKSYCFRYFNLIALSDMPSLHHNDESISVFGHGIRPNRAEETKRLIRLVAFCPSRPYDGSYFVRDGQS